MKTTNGYINPYQPVLLHLTTCKGCASVADRAPHNYIGASVANNCGVWGSMMRQIEEYRAKRGDISST